LKSDNDKIKRHRGSSPPFQDEWQGSFDFMKSYQSIYPNPENTSETQVHKQERYKTGKTIDQKLDSSQTKNLKTEHQSINDGE